LEGALDIPAAYHSQEQLPDSPANADADCLPVGADGGNCAAEATSLEEAMDLSAAYRSHEQLPDSTTNKNADCPPVGADGEDCAAEPPSSGEASERDPSAAAPLFSERSCRRSTQQSTPASNILSGMRAEPGSWRHAIRKAKPHKTPQHDLYPRSNQPHQQPRPSPPRRPGAGLPHRLQQPPEYPQQAPPFRSHKPPQPSPPSRSSADANPRPHQSHAPSPNLQESHKPIPAEPLFRPHQPHLSNQPHRPSPADLSHRPNQSHKPIRADPPPRPSCNRFQQALKSPPVDWSHPLNHCLERLWTDSSQSSYLPTNGPLKLVAIRVKHSDMPSRPDPSRSSHWPASPPLKPAAKRAKHCHHPAAGCPDPSACNPACGRPLWSGSPPPRADPSHSRPASLSVKSAAKRARPEGEAATAAPCKVAKVARVSPEPPAMDATAGSVSGSSSISSPAASAARGWPPEIGSPASLTGPAAAETICGSTDGVADYADHDDTHVSSPAWAEQRGQWLLSLTWINKPPRAGRIAFDDHARLR
jgi:hypothetical protein